MPSPPTHNRGSKTIDAIYVSETLTDIDSAGWLQFREGIGDHCIAFIDIKIEKLICKHRQHIARQPHQRLQIHLEGCVGFIKELISERLLNFRRQASNMSKTERQHEIDQIDASRLKVMLVTEKKCWRLQTGQVPYVPNEIQRYRQEIRFWTMLIQRKGSHCVSSKVIWR